nr:polyketide synthase [Paenibacillus sp. MER 180]
MSDLDIAIIGMAGRFPGAANIDDFWENISHGVESINHQLDKNFDTDVPYIGSRGILPDIEYFDAAFFGFNPREAEMLDPQQRLLLECAWSALEDSAYDPLHVSGKVGVFTGAGQNSYYLHHLLPRIGRRKLESQTSTFVTSANDFISTLISYKLNLKGPSLVVQTACSSSLVAIHLACQSLLTGECDLALAGGVSVQLPQHEGYPAVPGGIYSPDGKCRAFDEAANGTVPGNGGGIVIVKRLSDAITDKDRIRAIIKGSAINNDGSLKMGYTAPSIEGQAKVLAEAIHNAGVASESITLIETHGTGTPLGDPIELLALSQVYNVNKNGHCAISSVKPNIGHLDAAAGVASLIKAVCALENKQIPPSINYHEPNKQMKLEESPFYVNTELKAWESLTLTGTPRRAAVSSFGIGGTNAHIILQEAFTLDRNEPEENSHILTLSANTSTSLKDALIQMSDFLGEEEAPRFGDVAYTSRVGRHAFPYRQSIVAKSNKEARELLLKFLNEQQPFKKKESKGVCFKLAGSGSHYMTLGREIYKQDSIYRKEVEKCSQLLLQIAQVDIKKVFTNQSNHDDSQFAITLSENNHSILFTIEYALSKLWMEIGVIPEKIAGADLGEYVAACLADVFSLEDSLRLAVFRDRLSQNKQVEVSTNELDQLLEHYKPKRTLFTPKIPFISNITGDWITEEQATDFAYWTTLLKKKQTNSHARLRDDSEILSLDVGLGLELDSSCAYSSFLSAVSYLWNSGLDIEWRNMSVGDVAKVKIPTYSFDKQKYWIDAIDSNTNQTKLSETNQQISNYEPTIYMRTEFQEDIIHPRSEIEKKVVETWEVELGVYPIGLDDNFFELGGHSLASLDIVDELNKTFKINLSSNIFMDFPTPKETAKIIEEQLHISDLTEDNDIITIISTPELIYEPFPLTELAEGYFIGRNEGYEYGQIGSYIYREVHCEDIDLVRLNKAFSRLIVRHDMLRAVVFDDGQQQILNEVPPYTIKLETLNGLNEVEKQKKLLEIRREMEQNNSQSGQWPLFEIRASTFENKTIIHTKFDYLILDGMTDKILNSEWMSLYENLDMQLDKLEISYRDYVTTLVEFKQSNLYQNARKYWMDKIPTLPAAPQLPILKMKSNESNNLLGKAGVIRSDLWKLLKKQASRIGVTPSGLLLSVYAEIIGRWSSSQRFTLNMPIFSRIPFHKDVNKLVGSFTSTLLLEVDLTLGRTFKERAICIQEQLLRDLDHRYFNGTLVMREINKSTNALTASMPVVFTGLFVEGEDTDSQWLGTEVYRSNQSPQVWMDFQIDELSDGSLQFNWDFMSDVFPENMPEHMYQTFLKVIDSLCADEQMWEATSLIPLHDLQEERRFQDYIVNKGLSRLLYDGFEEQVITRPEHVAIVSENDHVSITYRELDILSSHVAKLLQEQVSDMDRPIAVLLEKGWMQVVAVLGVLRAGLVYLPLDASLPEARIRTILANSSTQTILTQTSIVELVHACSAEVRVVELDALDMPANKRSDYERRVHPQGWAYIIYTSGSTGEPKGVLIDHIGAMNTVTDINSRFNVTSDDRIAAFSSLGFDLSVYDVFGALDVGATIIIPKVITVKDSILIAAFVEREKISIWNSVPSMMSIYMDYMEEQHPPITNEHIRVILLSGDWIPLQLPNRIKQYVPNAKVISLGGATEASIWSICYPIHNVESDWNNIPYGKPLNNQMLYILNDRLELCPNGVVGQIYIGGVGLAVEYWKDFDRTRQSFIIHPETNERLYRTGDLGRYLPDNHIDILGRIDNQVKIRGYRIELEEITQTLNKCPWINQAVVLKKDLSTNESQLVAFVILEGIVNSHLESDLVAPIVRNIREYTKKLLPDYMVPAHFLLVNEFPYTSNGKLDRAALLSRSSAKLYVEVAATDEQIESRQESLFIKEIWKNTLKIENFSFNDNFFELGGDSVLAMRITAAVRQRYSVTISVRAFFELPTFKQFVIKVINEIDECNKDNV